MKRPVMVIDGNAKVGQARVYSESDWNTLKTLERVQMKVLGHLGICNQQCIVNDILLAEMKKINPNII